MATYSTTNGRIGLAAAVGCLVVAVLDGLGGNVAMAGFFGFFALLLGLQAMNDLTWEGSQDSVVVPLKRVFGALSIACGLWALVALLI